MYAVTAFDQYAEEYDRWFDRNEQIYQAEINAIRRAVPQTGFGVEVGVGTGRFSVPCGIKIGIEPAKGMAQIAKTRNISVGQAVGEHLPFRDDRFDFVLLVTVICFVDSVPDLLCETRRILKHGGQLIVGFIDGNSDLGRLYASRKDADKFYRNAHFYTAPEVAACIRQVGFEALRFCQTIIELPHSVPMSYEVRDGYGEGAFVVIRAIKPEGTRISV